LQRRVVWQKFADVSEIFAASIMRTIALMTKAASASETSISFYQTAQRYNPKDGQVHTRGRGNLKSYLHSPFSRSKSIIMERQ
jgi:hypothetical protein